MRLAGLQPVARQAGQREGPGGIQLEFVDAALPGAGDITGLAGQALAHRPHDEVGMPPGREIHHGPPSSMCSCMEGPY